MFSVSFNRSEQRKQGISTNKTNISPLKIVYQVMPWLDPEGGTGGLDPPGIARLLVFAMLKFSVRPPLGIWIRTWMPLLRLVGLIYTAIVWTSRLQGSIGALQQLNFHECSQQLLCNSYCGALRIQGSC